MLHVEQGSQAHTKQPPLRGCFALMPIPIAGCYLHFLCPAHVIEGHFEHRHGFAVECEVAGCTRLASGYWYRGMVVGQFEMRDLRPSAKIAG